MKRFDVEQAFESEEGHGWRVIARDVVAEYAESALRTTLSAGEHGQSFGPSLNLASDAAARGDYRVVERGGPFPFVSEFTVDVLRVLDIASVEAEPAVPEPVAA
jgi:hypothetical protein